MSARITVVPPVSVPKTDQTSRLLDALEPVLAKYRDSAERRWHLHSIKCLRLALDLETYEALLRGESVPRSRIDPEWARAYGL